MAEPSTSGTLSENDYIITVLSEKLNEMINNVNINISEIIDYMYKYYEYNLKKKFTEKRLSELLNDERGLKLFMSDKFKCPYGGDPKGKINYAIIHSNICESIFDIIIEDNNPHLFHIAAASGRYNLLVKLYEFNNDFINYVHPKTKDNCFHSGILSKNLDIMKFAYSIKPEFLYIPFLDGHTPFGMVCFKGTVEMIQWMHSIDQTLYITNISPFVQRSPLEDLCNYCAISKIKFLFMIDRNVFNKDAHKDIIIACINEYHNKDSAKELLDIIEMNKPDL